jgi:hypothetical protein
MTQREQEVYTFKFSKFYADPTTMGDLGLRLTAYISDVIEGAGGFAIDTLGNTTDEVVTIPMMTELTTPQIANEIVKLGSKGIWIMQAVHGDTGPKVGSTIVKIYSYHNAVSDIARISCPQIPPKTP